MLPPGGRPHPPPPPGSPARGGLGGGFGQGCPSPPPAFPRVPSPPSPRVTATEPSQGLSGAGPAFRLLSSLGRRVTGRRRAAEPGEA